MFITDNTAILNQHNSFVYEKSCFKTFTAAFLILKNKQYIFKTDVADSVDFMTADLIEKFIETFINISLSDDLTMTVSDSVICKLLEFK